MSFFGMPEPGTTPDAGHETRSGQVVVARAAESEENTSWTKKVWLTAYSSTPEETDDTPFITASMTKVRDGIVAANFLPFGTKIMIPDIFGDKVFVVEDRMHTRKTNFVDIWMPTKQDAIEFGISRAEIVVLQEG